jgi:ATP-dependent DNA helicase PIF1
MLNLNEQQQQIFNKYIAGENIFITGPGGTGKTHLIKAIVTHAKENNKAYKVCALTGCAAILLECGASTLHAFAGIGLATGTVNQVVDRVVKNRHKKPNWQKTDILIVDEVSMLSLKLFTILDLIAKKIKKQRTTQFGGMQIIFAGDFYQLPPVGDESEPETQAFCFETPLWNETFPLKNQIELQTIFRQTDDKYAKILNKLRIGKITNGAIATLEACVGKESNGEVFPTVLLPRRRDADALNSRKIALLDKETEKSYKIKQVPEEELPLTKHELQNLSLFTEKEIEFETGYLMDNIMAERELKLRKGTVVMCIANLNVESHRPIINGSQGVVVDYVDGYPQVKFAEDIIEVIGPHTWSSERIAGIAVKQIPLIYAWAVTIHKAQGLTLDRALIDIGGNIFECGQTYVALSRVKSLEGLHLKGFDFTKIKVNKKVQAFYKQFQLDD